MTEQEWTSDKALNEARDRAEEAAAEVKERVGEAVDQAKVELQERVRTVGQELLAKATEVKGRAAIELNTAAERLRAEARQSDDQEAIVRANQTAAALERTASYLSSRTVEQMGEDVTQAAQENIWQSLGIAFIIGIFVGLILGGRRN